MYVVGSTFFDYNKFSFSTLRKSNDDQVLKVYKTSTFSLSNVDKSMYTVFSICDNDKLYVFYTFISSGLHSYKNFVDYLNDKHLVTICIATMTVISIQKLTECTRYGTGGVMTQRESIERMIASIKHFEKLFFLKKVQKCFIKIFPLDELILVFDVKNKYFYFAEHVFPKGQIKYSSVFNYTVDKDDLVYRYKCRVKFCDVRELKTFQYCNDKLVDCGTKWQDSVGNINKRVKSICIV